MKDIYKKIQKIIRSKKIQCDDITSINIEKVIIDSLNKSFNLGKNETIRKICEKIQNALKSAKIYRDINYNNIEDNILSSLWFCYNYGKAHGKSDQFEQLIKILKMD